MLHKLVSERSGAAAAVQADDLVVSCSGTIGRAFKIPKGAPEGIINQALLKLTLNQSIIDPDYFLAFFQWSAFQERILESTQGGAMKNLVGMPIFKATEISLPPLGEQMRIAETFRDLCSHIAATERLIAKTRATRQGMTQQLLTGKTRLPGYNKSWGEVRLGDHVSYVKTAALSRAQLDSQSPLRYLHYGDIHTSTEVTLDAARQDMPRVGSGMAGNAGRLLVGDLVFADASEDQEGVGKSVEIVSVPTEGVIPGLHTIAARFDKSVLANGFKAYLQFNPEFRNALLRLAAGTKVLATTRSYISSVQLSLPEVDEQHAIAQVLHDADKEIDALQKKLDKARAIKQGIMHALLTGNTRLPVKEPVA